MAAAWARNMHPLKILDPPRDFALDPALLGNTRELDNEVVLYLGVQGN